MPTATYHHPSFYCYHTAAPSNYSCLLLPLPPPLLLQLPPPQYHCHNFDHHDPSSPSATTTTATPTTPLRPPTAPTAATATPTTPTAPLQVNYHYHCHTTTMPPPLLLTATTTTTAAPATTTTPITAATTALPLLLFPPPLPLLRPLRRPLLTPATLRHSSTTAAASLQPLPLYSSSPATPAIPTTPTTPPTNYAITIRLRIHCCVFRHTMPPLLLPPLHHYFAAGRSGPRRS